MMNNNNNQHAFPSSFIDGGGVAIDYQSYSEQLSSACSSSFSESMVMCPLQASSLSGNQQPLPDFCSTDPATSATTTGRTAALSVLFNEYYDSLDSWSLFVLLLTLYWMVINLVFWYKFLAAWNLIARAHRYDRALMIRNWSRRQRQRLQKKAQKLRNKATHLRLHYISCFWWWWSSDNINMDDNNNNNNNRNHNYSTTITTTTTTMTSTVSTPSSLDGAASNSTAAADAVDSFSDTADSVTIAGSASDGYNPDAVDADVKQAKVDDVVEDDDDEEDDDEVDEEDEEEEDGAAEDVVDAAAALISLDSINIMCPICLVDFTEQERVTACDDGGCGTWFHNDCLSEWTRYSDSCPCCRKDLTHTSLSASSKSSSSSLSAAAGASSSSYSLSSYFYSHNNNRPRGWLSDLSVFLGYGR